MNHTAFLVNKDFTGRNYHSVTNGLVDYSGEMTYTDGLATLAPGLPLAEYMEREGMNPLEWSLIPEECFRVLYLQKEREIYLTPATVISKADWYEMLECLPPENWTRTGGIEHFRMCEYTTGSITNQYANRDGKYIVKAIDVCDRSTWITLEDFEGAGND